MHKHQGNKKTVSVSIVAANYNNGRFLDEFILSVANSSVLPEELILVDDGSTDESSIILDRIRYPWLKSVFLKSNKGFTAALNTGVGMAKGKYIMRADPDDVFMPDRIGEQFRFMESNPSVDVCGSNVAYFRDQPDKIINVSNFPQSMTAIQSKYVRGEHGLQHPTIIAKAEVMKRYPYGKIYPGEDYELFARMITDGCVFANIREPLYGMRVHRASSTSRLKFEGIRQTFQFRDQIFGSRTPWLKMRMYYSYIKNYRNYQLADRSISKYYYLLVSVLSYPTKLITRLTDAERNLRVH